MCSIDAKNPKKGPAAEDHPDQVEEDVDDDGKPEGIPMNWGDNAPGASTLLAKRLIRAISGPDFELLLYVAGANLVVVDARTCQRCTVIYILQCLHISKTACLPVDILHLSG